MSDYPIPEDLKASYNDGKPLEPDESWQHSFVLLLIERIAKLEAEAAEVKLLTDVANSHIKISMTLLESVKELIRSRDSFSDMWKRTWADNGELEAEKASLQSALDAQTAKFEGCPHSQLGDAAVCGCSYDKPSDVCALHAPQLRKALEENARLEAEVERLTAPVKFEELRKAHNGSPGAIGADGIDRLIAARAQEPKEKP
jgi:hypothetical protein